MLNCAARKASEGRIPSHLLDLYVQYKQDTRAAIAWLVSHGTSEYKRLQTLSLKDLFGLAEIVQTKAVEMPDPIDFHFRETIAARSQLSRYFQRARMEGTDDQANDHHEHFTARLVRQTLGNAQIPSNTRWHPSSLTKIHSDLCACCAKPKDRSKAAHHRRPSQETESIFRAQAQLP